MCCWSVCGPALDLKKRGRLLVLVCRGGSSSPECLRHARRRLLYRLWPLLSLFIVGPSLNKHFNLFQKEASLSIAAHHWLLNEYLTRGTYQAVRPIVLSDLRRLPS